jgi:hypothetical protein
MKRDLDVNHLAILESMPSLATRLRVRSSGSHIIDNLRTTALLPNICYRHFQKLISRIAVVLDCGVIDLEELKRSKSVDPHGLWVFEKQRTKISPGALLVGGRFSIGGSPR